MHIHNAQTIIIIHNSHIRIEMRMRIEIEFCCVEMRQWRKADFGKYCFVAICICNLFQL